MNVRERENENEKRRYFILFYFIFYTKRFGGNLDLFNAQEFFAEQRRMAYQKEHIWPDSFPECTPELRKCVFLFRIYSNDM
jgi:hypothetical protein